jgi:phosphatidylglycerol:prolipoprotein diacylglycerol transferase
MFPRLFHIGSFYLPTYGVVLAIAYLTGIWLLRRKAVAEGLPDQKILDLSLYILASAILGAKLMLVIVEWRRYKAHPADLVEVLRSGGVFYGGLICATVVGIWYLRKHRLPAWQVTDMAAPSIALGEAIGRWGCFAAGCCYGKPSDGPLRVTFTDPFAHDAVGTPLNTPLHPTQLYLSLNSLLIFLVLQWAYKRRSFDGEVFWLYVLLTRSPGDHRGVEGRPGARVPHSGRALHVPVHRRPDCPRPLAMLFYLARRSRAEEA